MIEFGVVLELFKDLLGLIRQTRQDRRQSKQDRREMFERTCKPLYDGLQPIVNEYYLIIDEAIRRLEQPKLTKSGLRELVADVEKRRAQLLIVRDRIVGEAEAFKSSYHEKRGDGFAQRVLPFAASISKYFDDAHNSFAETRYTSMQGLLVDIGQLVPAQRDGEDAKPQPDAPRRAERSRPTGVTATIKDMTALKFGAGPGGIDLKQVIENAKGRRKALESRWREVARLYNELRLFCES